MVIQVVSRTSLRLCHSLRFSASELRFYSTQPMDHVTSEDTATSDGDCRDRGDRTHHLEYMRQYMARRRADPEFRAQEHQEQRERYARNPAKHVQRVKGWYVRKTATDPEWASAYRQKCLSRYFNPKTHETSKDVSRQYQRSRRAKDPTYQMRDYVRDWVMNHKWVRDDLDWTPWTPVLYPEKTEHRCQECGAARHKGAKLWL